MTRLVLLPGLDGTGELFASFIAALRGLPTQVIAYPPDRPMNYAAHEQHARPQLPHDEDYVLLAESFSGPVGISIAASAPPRLKGLVLCASFAANPLPLLGPLSRLIGILPAARVPVALTEPWLYAGRGTPELRRAHAAAMSRVSAKVLRARVAAVLAVDHRELLARIAVPMLYLRASKDRLIPASAASAILRARPDMKIVEIEAPHFLLQTEPRKCAVAIMNFLSSAHEADAKLAPIPNTF
jgi:pimeloyl-ACP methyl ester carboxylesterase